MTLRNRAAHFAWPRRWCLAAAALLAIAHLSGCSHNRSTTYRPIFARPTSGCSTCGGSSTTVTTEAPSGVPTTTVPSLSAPSTDSSVTPSASIRRGSGGLLNSTVEQPPMPGPAPSRNPSGTLTHPRSATAPSRPHPRRRPSPPGPSPARPCKPRRRTRTVPGPPGMSTAPPPGLPGVRPERAARGGDRAGGPAGALYRRLGRQRAVLSQQGRPPLAVHRAAPQRSAARQLRPDRRASTASSWAIDGCGYHFVIGNGNGSGDGQIEVAQRWNNQKQGVHCRNARTHDVDEYGIGICLVGDLDQQPPTPRQIAAAQALDRVPQPALQHRPGPRHDPCPPRRHPDRLPGQVLPDDAILALARPARSRAPVRAAWKVVRDRQAELLSLVPVACTFQPRQADRGSHGGGLASLCSPPPAAARPRATGRSRSANR